MLLIGASYLIGQLTAGQDIKIIKDLGLAATRSSGCSSRCSSASASSTRKSSARASTRCSPSPCAVTSSSSASTSASLLTLAVNVAAMTVALYAVLGVMSWTAAESERLAWDTPALDPALVKAVVLIFGELAIVTACALFFSSFSTPILSAALTCGLFLIGRFNADLRNFDQIVSSPAAVWLARGLYYTLPNLAPFDVKAAVVHGHLVPSGYILMTLAYAAVYIAVLVIVTALVFGRRDFR